MDRAVLEFRAHCIREIRRFFEESGYLEVDTPVIARRVIPEPTIDLLSTTIHGPGEEGPGTKAFLLPSPELYMKRLVAAGSGSIFQLSRCFRDSEPASSRLHTFEFLMLEWYTLGADYIDSLETTEALIEGLCRRCDVPAHVAPALLPPFVKMTVNEAFREYADIDLSACNETRALLTEARRVGLTPAADADWSELFHLILVARVEPNLRKERPVVLLDYPARVSCLAKQKPGTMWRERWELYLRGVEIANCFTETVSPEEVATYFRHAHRKLEESGRTAQTDQSFPGIYETGHPLCSGVAMGVDRLLMVLSEAASITEVMPFPPLDRDAQKYAI